MGTINTGVNRLDVETVKLIGVLLGILGALGGYVGVLFRKAESYKLLHMKVNELEKRVEKVEKDMAKVQTEMGSIEDIKTGIDDLKKSLSLIEKFILGVADKDDVLSSITNR